MNLMQKMREQKLLSFSLVLFTLSLGILIGTFLDRGVLAEKEHAASGGDPLAIPSPVELSTAFTELANRLEPSVANIQTDFVRKPSETEHKFSQPGPKEFEEDDQGMELFRRFFGHMPPPRREATGSGVIVDSDGYILTNFHVVDGADRIRVKLSGEPTEYEAKMIGTDKETDLAVIKIEVPRKLVAAKIGNSDSVQVGDWAVAIGSPFGLAATVTAGIISAKERDSTEVQGAEAFQHFLQTDAAINPGNSGGPLLNINGEVIGINSAIATQVGTYQGVGFALPINMAVKVYNQLIKTGRVTRGSIGVFLEGEPKPELLKVYDAKHGAFITGVEPESPADKAGLKEEDVIVALNGNPIRNNADLVSTVSDNPVGSKATLLVVRKGQEKEFRVTIGDRMNVFANDSRVGKKSPEQATVRKEPTNYKLGFLFKALTEADKEELNFKQAGGVLITEVDPASLADDIDLKANDVIVEINRQPVNSVGDVQRIQRALKPGDPVAFKLMRPYVSVVGKKVAPAYWSTLYRAGSLRGK